MILTISSNLIYSENFYFYTKTTFAVSQFWEGFSKNDTQIDRKLFTNILSGSMGLGFEMVIWDMGIKRGSRLYVRTGIDLVFSGSTYTGFIDVDTKDGSMYPVNLHGGVFFTGLDMDIYFGGTFPKTDLLWGFGAIFNFDFPSYSPYKSVDSFNNKYYFYAVPSILLGYDIMIPDTMFKVTPMIRAGITCLPITTTDVINEELSGYKKGYNISTYSGYYSGFYVDFSVGFSFFSKAWKK
jgi:hypothetical protein